MVSDESDVWPRYFAATRDKPAHPLFDLLDEYLPESGDAIDLGCGTGRGTLRLLARGLSVTATDIAAEAIEIVGSRAPDDPMLRTICAPFEELTLEEYDVAVACFSLFFMAPAAFGTFWERVVASLRPGGLFAGEFLGTNDEWAARGYAVHSRDDVGGLLEPFNVLYLKEDEEDGQTAIGEQKHWHVFHVIARKR